MKLHHFMTAAASTLCAGASIAADYDIYRVPALLPPPGTVTNIQLANLTLCKAEAESREQSGQSLSDGEKAQLSGVVTQDFFSKGQPIIGETWYPAATLNGAREHDQSGVPKLFSDAFVACFIRLGYSYGTFEQRLRHK
jgi:hypothetical protein